MKRYSLPGVCTWPRNQKKIIYHLICIRRQVISRLSFYHEQPNGPLISPSEAAPAHRGKKRSAVTLAGSLQIQLGSPRGNEVAAAAYLPFAASLLSCHAVLSHRQPLLPVGVGWSRGQMDTMG